MGLLHYSICFTQIPGFELHPEGMPASVGHKKDKSRKKGVTEKKGSDPFFGGNDQRNRKSGSIQGTEPLEIITDQT